MAILGRRLRQLDTTATSRPRQAYEAVLDAFVAEYGESVLATPRSKFSWLLPSLAAVGGLGLLVVVGRRWVTQRPGRGVGDRRRRPTRAEDEAYADKLDDELAETD